MQSRTSHCIVLIIIIALNFIIIEGDQLFERSLHLLGSGRSSLLDEGDYRHNPNGDGSLYNSNSNIRNQQKARRPAANKTQPKGSGGTQASASLNASRMNTQRRPNVKRIVHPSLHAAWDEYNSLCVLAKFQATFVIKYETASGTAQLIDKMPVNSRSKGRCDQFDEEPVLDVMWRDSQLTGSQKPNSTGGFTFRIIFQKYSEQGYWGVQQMQFLYNTGHPVFRGAINPRKFIVRSSKDDYRLQFHTKLSESMLCPSPPPIQMYDIDGKPLVIARLTNLQLQAFEFAGPKGASNFDGFTRCEQVSYGSGVAHTLALVRNDSLTFATGVMTVCVAGLTVVGYAVYRNYVVSTEKYKNII